MLDIAPLSKPTVFLIGIGGIGMSGIAEILKHQGYYVMGSDASASQNTARLEANGIKVFIGHRADNVRNADVVVHSSAITKTNPELTYARDHHIPILTRAEMLAEIMRFYLTIAVSGTHGKTTTTSLIAHVLSFLDPTVVNGGIVNAYGSNIRIGNSKWMVVEADESDGTFVRVPASIGVVTNIDPEHLDHYGSFQKLKDSFGCFIHQVSFYGFALLCADHPVVLEVSSGKQDKRIITYGFHKDSMVRGENIQYHEKGATFDVVIRGQPHAILTKLFLPMLGEHNVQNALAAIALALQMGCSPDKIRTQLASFEGVKRRFTVTGSVSGVTFIDDYAHHPVEVEAVLRAAKTSYKGRIIAIFQPHRYSRLKQFFNEFANVLSSVDHLVVTPVWAAGEKPVKGINAQTFINHFSLKSHNRVAFGQNFEETKALIEELAKPGDRVIFLGAGNITSWAQEMPTKFKQIEAS